MPPVPPGAGWVTYVRCHDDIGWAITPEDAARVGEDAHLHRRFLADFYAGDFPGSFARGARFQPDAATGEARTTGTRRRWPGSSRRGGDELARELAVRRVLLLYAVAFAHGGLPADLHGRRAGAAQRPRVGPGRRTSAGDNRWMHRPPMDWAAAERRHDPGSGRGRLWAGLRRLIAARRATRAMHAQGAGRAAVDRQRSRLRAAADLAGERLLVLANFSADEQRLRRAILDEHGLRLTDSAAVPDGRPLRTDDGQADPRAVPVPLDRPLIQRRIASASSSICRASSPSGHM